MLVEIIAWNFYFLVIKPIVDVVTAVLLSFMSYGLNKYFN